MLAFCIGKGRGEGGGVPFDFWEKVLVCFWGAVRSMVDEVSLVCVKTVDAM